MTESEAFHLGDLISITDGHLVAPGHMDAVVEVLEFLTESTLFTHQLPNAGRAVEGCVYEQHPFLREIHWDESISEIEDGDYRKTVIDVWLGRLVEQYGEYHTLVTAADWAARNK